MPTERTWVLDLDGTLLNLPVDIEAVRAGVVELFALAGVEANPRPLLEGIRGAALEAAPGNEEEQASWRARGFGVIDAAELEAARSATPCAGADAFIKALGREPVAVVTNNAGEPAYAALVRCGLLPRNLVAMVGRKPHRPAKPAPEPMLRALEDRPEPLGEIIVVGDRPADMAMAAAARRPLAARGGQVRAIGVVGKLEGEAVMVAAGAEAVCKDLAELLHLVREN